jgi:type 1 glutamine amidotransferase
VAVVIGEHNYEVPAFHDLLRSLPGITCYPQDLDNLVADEQGAFDDYQVLLFYSMQRSVPAPKAQALLQHPATAGQGIVILHHALLAFPGWSTWSEMCGIEDRSFEYYHDQSLDIEIADPAHPITAGTASWHMIDETYLMQGPGTDSHALLTTDHPKSMPVLAWTRQVGQSRVVCFACGHDHQAYGDASFRRILARSILWAGRRI